MASTFRQVVEQVINMSRVHNERGEALQKKHGMEMGLTYEDPKADAFVKESRELGASLRNYLDSLDEETVRKVETMAYLGRDHEDDDATDLSDLHRHTASHSQTKADAVRTIVEKIPALVKYLPAALEKAGRNKIDIEKPFTR